MKRNIFIRFSTAATLVAAASISSSSLSLAQALYNLGGKNVEAKDLTPGQQQQLFDVQFESYEKTRMAVDEIIFENHVAAESTKQGKTTDETMKKMLEGKAPTDKEIKKWYEDNKAKIPPNLKFEDIKDKIGDVVRQERMKAKRDEILEKIKKDQKFSFAVPKPVAPVVDVKIDGFVSKGKDGSKVTIVEFADYQCPHCKHASETYKKVFEKFKDKIKMVYVDFPINPSGISRIVAEGSHCANALGKFWEYHYKAFEGQATLTKDSPMTLAKELKLDEGKFKACMDSGTSKAIVDKGRAEGERIGVSGTPYILINGRKWSGSHDDIAQITAEIQSLLK